MLIDNFEDFALVLNLDEKEVRSWKDTIQAQQSKNPQQLITTSHNNHNDHSNHSNHTDDTDHTNYTDHTDRNPHTDRDGENDHTNHGNGYHDKDAAKHYDIEKDVGHDNTYGHYNNGHKDGHYNKSYEEHADGYDHWDKYYQNHSNKHSNQAHRDKNNHTDYDDHTNRNPHTDKKPHSDKADNWNIGFNHNNYIPYKPSVNIENKVVRDTYNLQWYSYDKNISGYGSQDTKSKTVKYFTKLRKVQNLDGSSSVSGWRTLSNGSTNEKFNLNTIDPLNVGNTDKKAYEGIYEIEIYAINDSMSLNGVTKHFVGKKRNVFFTIRQNYDPVVTVNNHNEFVNYNFGYNTKIANYGNGNIEINDGINVDFTLTDRDLGDYHSGVGYLTHNDNVITNKYDIDFSGSNSNKKGKLSIPKSDFLNDGNLENVMLVLDIKDYTNSAMTIEAGSHLVQSKVSLSGKNMIFNIDRSFPTVIIDEANPMYVEEETVNVMVSDVGQGVKERYYQIVKNGSPINNNNWISKNSNNFNVTLKNSGHYEIYVKVIDKAGNMKTVKSDIFKISPITTNIRLSTEYPNFIPASEKLFVDVNTKSFAEVIKVEMWFENRNNNKVVLTTLDTGEVKDWDGEIKIPLEFVDQDYNLFFKFTRVDGSSITETKLVKVFTPIMLQLKEVPIFEEVKPFDIIAETTKYPTNTDVKLFVGTPFETDWLSMNDYRVSSHKEWIRQYQINDIDSGIYNMTLRSSIPNGKTETITEPIMYVSVNNKVLHTEEWEKKRKEFNLAKTGNENIPRGENVFYSGEKFVLETNLDTPDENVFATKVTAEIVGTTYKTELTSDDNINWYGDLWDESFIDKWGNTTPEVLNIRFTIDYNIGNAQSIEDVEVIVDNIEKYFELHRDR